MPNVTNVPIMLRVVILNVYVLNVVAPTVGSTVDPINITHFVIVNKLRVFTEMNV
jgi:hypothetical protein